MSLDNRYKYIWDIHKDIYDDINNHSTYNAFVTTQQRAFTLKMTLSPASDSLLFKQRGKPIVEEKR
jgi:hypothetical protein